MSFNAIEAGKAFLKVYVDDKDVAPAFDRIQSKTNSFFTSFSRIAAPAAAVGTALAAASAVLIEFASDAQETMSKFDVVFGKSSKSMKEFSDKLADELGRSKYAIAGSLASFQDLLVPMGMMPAAAEEVSKKLAALAVDLGSFNNMADDDVIRDLQAALTGSGEVMKKYGVIVSEAAVKQQLLNQGLNPSTASEAQKAMARLEIILRGTTAAQGDAVRTADGYANQMKRLSSNASDAAVELGNILLPAAAELTKVAAAATKTFGEFAHELPGATFFLDALTSGASGAAGALVALAEAQERVNKAMGGRTSVVGALKMGTPKLGEVEGSSPTTFLLGQAMEIAGRQWTHPPVPFANAPNDDPWQRFLSRTGAGGIDAPGKLGRSKLQRRLSGWLESAGNVAGGMVPTIPGVALSGAGTTAKQMVKGNFDWERLAKEAGQGIREAWRDVSGLIGGGGADGKSFTSTATFSAQAAALMGGPENVQQEMLNVEKAMLTRLDSIDRNGGMRARG